MLRKLLRWVVLPLLLLILLPTLIIGLLTSIELSRPVQPPARLEPLPLAETAQPAQDPVSSVIDAAPTSSTLASRITAPTSATLTAALPRPTMLIDEASLGDPKLVQKAQPINREYGTVGNKIVALAEAEAGLMRAREEDRRQQAKGQVYDRAWQHYLQCWRDLDHSYYTIKDALKDGFDPAWPKRWNEYYLEMLIQRRQWQKAAEHCRFEWQFDNWNTEMYCVSQMGEKKRIMWVFLRSTEKLIYKIVYPNRSSQ